MTKLQHHTFYFQKDWNTHFEDIFRHKKIPNNPCFYLSLPSSTDSEVSPKGSENLFILVPLGVDSPEASSKPYLNQVLRHVENTIGESFTKEIVFQRVFAQREFKQEFNAYKGNALGLAHTLKQSLFLRPKMRSSKITNLYYAGQFTQPGVGVPMAIISAELVAKQLAKDFL